MVSYINEAWALVINFESSLASRTVTPSQPDVPILGSQTVIFLAIGAILLFFHRRKTLNTFKIERFSVFCEE